MPHPVHRLDLNTSGVLLFGKNAGAASRLMRSFETHETRKRYAALCTATGALDTATNGALDTATNGALDTATTGALDTATNGALDTATTGALDTATTGAFDTVDAQSSEAAVASSKNRATGKAAGEAAAGTLLVDAPICRVAGVEHCERRCCDPNEEGGQEARTQLTLVARAKGGGGACAVLAAPQHGRTHQVRLHCARAGAPLLADPLYNIDHAQPPTTQPALAAFAVAAAADPSAAAAVADTAAAVAAAADLAAAAASTSPAAAAAAVADTADAVAAAANLASAAAAASPADAAAAVADTAATVAAAADLASSAAAASPAAAAAAVADTAAAVADTAAAVAAAASPAFSSLLTRHALHAYTLRLPHSMVKVQSGQCPSSAPGGSGQLGTPRERPALWAPSHCLGCSS